MVRLGFHRVDSLVLLRANLSCQDVLLLEILNSLLHGLLTLELPVATLETLTYVQWWSPETVVSILPVSS